ncbi:hypothetical protein BO85DRAFT_490594 [Aspergillus piperis CBS 112811]|uniref:Ankyrin n=1 Tax=Aspergillus piperis CBS 112811 TaxID=1448313 RepID=A0A8G1QWG7_9EURO|nr:hypothetical protein BO85DRAFT_490594 [Aspergillus piperis CBS 112811]RAH54939.1 hypothetical protein BO85DRAFT_490594 [Aspergillus piperis CBS 112811]
MLGPLSALMPWVRRDLSWMTLSFRPLNVQGLAIAVVCRDSLPNQDMLRHLPLDLEGDLTRALGPLIDFRNGQPMFANEYVRDYINNELTAKLNSSGDYSCEVSTHADLTRSRLTFLEHSGVAQAGPRGRCRIFWEQSALDFSQDCFKPTPLTLAAEHGLYEVVHDLISSSVSKPVSSQEMTEALEIALQFGHLDVARQLLLETNPSNESFVLASRAGDTELVTDILQKLGALACTCLESLQAAVIRGHLQTIDVLLQLLPDVSVALEDNPSLYLDAIGSGKSEVLGRLLDVGPGHLAVIPELIRRIGDPPSASVMEEGANSRNHTSSRSDDEEDREEAENSSDGVSKEEEFKTMGSRTLSSFEGLR